MSARPHSSLLLVPLALACATERGALVNRMDQTATPYLASAARQPVSWQPWSRDVFALAARLDRPVLLYVGAEDCRWCTVMDREVYSNPDLGALIDSLFVPVRVDRDERPDATEWNYQAQDEQEVVDSIEDVRKPELDETERRLMPARIEADAAGLDERERMHDTPRVRLPSTRHQGTNPMPILRHRRCVQAPRIVRSSKPINV